MFFVHICSRKYADASSNEYLVENQNNFLHLWELACNKACKCYVSASAVSILNSYKLTMMFRVSFFVLTCDVWSPCWHLVQAPCSNWMKAFWSTGRLRLKIQKIHRVNLVRLNLLKSREIIERHWICPRRNRPGPYKKKYGDAFENDFRARLSVMMKIHSRFIAWPLNRFTHVESIQPGFQVLSNGHESIQRTRFNGFKFNWRRPLCSRTIRSSCSLQ